jgi:hypothetical protein
MGTMHVLCAAGDILVQWDPGDERSAEQARAEYDRLRDDGYEFYEVERARGKRLKRWRKGLGVVIAAPGVRREADRPPAVEKPTPARAPARSRGGTTGGGRRRAMAGGPSARRIVDQRGRTIARLP